MPRQNRVDPFGEIARVPERGTLMGNRGILHGAEVGHAGDGHGTAEGRIVRRWAARAWIACVLQFKGRQRAVMSPNSYTELFFLDEATSLAAGHRPCAECRRADFLRFRAAWLVGNPGHGLGSTPRIGEIDRVLHAERVEGVGRAARKRTHRAPLSELPDGAMVVRDAAPEAPLLRWRGILHAWSFGGYGPPLSSPPDETVGLLTPPSTVAAIRAGYVPSVHRSIRVDPQARSPDAVPVPPGSRDGRGMS